MTALSVFQLQCGQNGARAMLVDHEAWDKWRGFGTTESLAKAWRPPPVRFYKPGETGLSGDSRKRPLPTDTDMPCVFSGIMVLVSQRFVTLAGETFRRFGEFLPCVSPDGSFYLFHCTTVIDALDDTRSEFSRSSSTGQILNVLRRELIPDECVFRLKQGNPYLVFVTGAVRAMLQRLPLKGVGTKHVWSSDAAVPGIANAPAPAP